MTTKSELKRVLPAAERKPYLRTLAWLCLCDGSLADEERSFLRDVAKGLKLPVAAVDEAIKRADACRDVHDAVRGLRTRWVKLQLVHQLLLVAMVDTEYDARERSGVRRVARALSIASDDVERLEAAIATDLVAASHAAAEAAKTARTKSSGWSWKRAAIVGGVALGAGALAAVTGGLAAPAIGGAIGTFMGLSGAAATSAGLAALGGGSLAAGGFGMAGGVALISTTLGLGAGGLAASKSVRRTAGIQDFDFVPLGGTSPHVVLGISGFLSNRSDFARDWQALEAAFPHAERYALRWESETLMRLSQSIGAAGAKLAARYAVAQVAKHATKAAGTLLTAPAAVLSALDLIDNPWHMARDRARKTGDALAACIMSKAWGSRPITLVGFSLGARVIIRALEVLHEEDRHGAVDSVYLLGGAVADNDPGLDCARRVVSSEIVNAYSKSDWVLQYLFRAAELLDFPIGLGPVERRGITDLDVTALAPGHLAYRETLEPLLLMARAKSEALASRIAKMPAIGKATRTRSASTSGSRKKRPHRPVAKKRTVKRA